MSAETSADDPVDVCEYAFNAAMEEGLKHCSTEDAQIAVLGQIVGLDGAAVDREQVLEDGPTGGDGDDQTRGWVLARAKELIDTEDTAPLSAVNQAWAEVGDQMEPEPDPVEEIEPEDEEEDDEEPLEADPEDDPDAIPEPSSELDDDE